MTRRGERGQSTVEFALILPLVVMMALLVVQVGMVISAQLVVTHTAREVARAIAVNPSADIDQVIAEVSTLSSDQITVQLQFEPAGVIGRETVLVSISYEVAPVVALFGQVTSILVVEGTAKMLVET